MDPVEFIAQDKFDKAYITSTEIAKRLQVTRPAIHFRRNAGLLPGAIRVSDNQLFIWERDNIEPFILKWEAQLQSKRPVTTS